MGSPIAGRSLWRNRDLGLVLVGETVNNVGDWMLAVALPVFVYVETGSGLATGAVFIIELALPILRPRPFGSGRPTAGSLAGRFESATQPT